MAVTTRFSIDEGEATIVVTERFDLYCRKEFRKAVEDAESRVERISIDLSSLAVIDSAAIGMLLRARKPSNEISIICSEGVRDVLEVMRLDTVFDLI